MQIKNIAAKIITLDNVPVFFNDTQTFSSVTYLKPNTDKERGLYLPDCDSSEAFEYCKFNIPDSFERIKELICTKCEFDEMTFVIFCIFHELGHWIQYKSFVDQGYDDNDFIAKYEMERALLFWKRNEEYKACRCKEDIVNLNKKYDRLYAELPTERYANNFAMEHILEGIMMFL